MPKDDRATKTGTAGGDISSAKQVLLSAAASATGRARLTTQAYTAHEAKAIALLAGNSGTLCADDARLFNEALLPYGANLTTSSTWANVLTAIAAS